MSYGVSQLNRFARVCSHVNELKVQISNSAISIINFGRLLPNFIVDTMNLFLNSMHFEPLQKLRVRLDP